jgi:hypothetical protein
MRAFREGHRGHVLVGTARPTSPLHRASSVPSIFIDKIPRVVCDSEPGLRGWRAPALKKETPHASERPALSRPCMPDAS